MADGVHVELKPPVAFILQQSGAFRRALANLEPLWDRFKPILGEIEAEQFSSQGHGAWPGLAASTLAQKAAHGYPADPLVRTGDLRESLVNPGRAAQSSGDTLIYASDVDYAGYHQDGTSKMPQRKVIDLRTDDRRRLEQETVAWIDEVARDTWGRI